MVTGPGTTEHWQQIVGALTAENHALQVALSCIFEDIYFGVDANGVPHVDGLAPHQIREPGPGWQSIKVDDGATAWWHQGLAVLVYNPPSRVDGGFYFGRWMWRVVPQPMPSADGWCRRPAGGDYVTAAEAMAAAEECGTDEWEPQQPPPVPLARRKASACVAAAD
jgi:hypothetical protein